MRIIIILLLISLLSTSCRTLGGLGGFPSGFGGGGTKRKSYAKRIVYLAGFVTYAKSIDELVNCKFVKEVSSIGGGGAAGQSQAKDDLSAEATRLGADTILITKDEGWGASKTSLRGKAYRCDRNEKRPELIFSNAKNLHRNSDFSAFAGSYLTRHGILRELGETGPTIGLLFADYSGRLTSSINKHGFFGMWTMDHFWKTNSKLLKPKFINENFTNYMFGGGYAFRHVFNEKFQFSYKGGFALNFIEIDTFGPGDAQMDEEYSDVTISTIHRISADYLLIKKRNPVLDKQVRIGPSLFYYFAPDPIGKFSNDEKNQRTGGSLAWSIDIIWENY
ncbi:MAG: hypothetical protein GY909_06765 [Oligoflexia bacterium]|nr:hypothetical protein [Oligoflexia bacterium]